MFGSGSESGLFRADPVYALSGASLAKMAHHDTVHKAAVPVKEATVRKLPVEAAPVPKATVAAAPVPKATLHKLPADIGWRREDTRVCNWYRRPRYHQLLCIVHQLSLARLVNVLRLVNFLGIVISVVCRLSRLTRT